MVLCLIGCSRKKDKFLNRNWHAVTAEYNTFYNGNLALELGKQELSDSYFDNYWAILPVERLQLSEDVMLPGYTTNPNFERAEEKAIKAIQRHSMLIDGSEQNPQMDEAYLLLGKARYYDQRFIPALEAFNYILHKYPLSNTITEARIWREKANIRLEFHEVAIENLKEILEQEDLEEDDLAHASAMLAQAYMDTEKEDSAVAYISTAAELTDDNDLKGRYLFIKGQLYDFLGKKDSANMAFDEVIDLHRRTSREYYINAHIAKLHNMDIRGEDRFAALELLEELAKDRENRPFLDKIYFQMGDYFYGTDSLDLAVDYYNQSLKQASDDIYLRSLNYQTLGNINFDAANYQMAGAYYDSTLANLNQLSREYRMVKKKRDNLEDVIYYEEIASENDSILYLAGLSEEQQLEYFTAHTEMLKEEAREALTAATEGQAVQPGGFLEPQQQGIPGVPDPSNAFYFYNPTTVAYGKEEFFRQWGNIELTDNWRYGGEANTSIETGEVVLNEELLFENNPVFDPQTYISQIPSDPQLLDSLADDRNFAYYQLGLIYGEKFEKNLLAMERLEILLDNDPEERLILPAKYQLYKLYQEEGISVKAESMKNDILHQYPDSRYASIIRNPAALLKDENSPDAVYAEVYELFEEQEYEEVIHQSSEAISAFTGEEIVPKFELLKAMATGRLMGFEAYKEALNYVALTYPQSDEGKKAQQLFTVAIPDLQDQSFQADSIEDSYKLIFPMRRAEAAAVNDLQEEVKKILQTSEYSQLQVSTDIYDPQELFIVVHGFQTPERASGFVEQLPLEDGQEIPFFTISRKNYSVVQIHKNKEAYLNTLNQIPQ